MKIACAALLIMALTGCAVTEQAEPSTVAQQPAASFLGDYSQLKPGQNDQMTLVYIKPDVDWSKYNRIIIDPVQIWDSPNTQISEQDHKVLASYYYNVLKEDLSKNFTVVEQPGPGVLRLRVALTNPTTATPVLRTVSVVIPQARVLNLAKNAATGTYAFVGSAQSEGEVLDSVTGERLAAAVDRRTGGLSVKNADDWEWGDAENAMNFWAGRIDERLVALRAGKPVASR